MCAYAAARQCGMTAVAVENRGQVYLGYDSVERKVLVEKEAPALQLLEWPCLVGELRCT
jgi:hypothetical protein